ncbi:hypothetical protein [Kangiella sp. M94]
MKILTAVSLGAIIIGGCSYLKTPGYLNINEEDKIRGKYCYNFKEDSVDVYYKRLRKNGERYRGDLAFVFNPNDLVSDENIDKCIDYHDIYIIEAYNQTFIDNVTERIIINFVVRVNGNRFEVQGKSSVFNALVDFSSESTQKARREAIKEAFLKVMNKD